MIGMMSSGVASISGTLQCQSLVLDALFRHFRYEHEDTG